MVKINRKTYRKKKLEWFESNQKLTIKGFEMREKEYRLRKRESELLTRRSHLDMELTNMRITREKVEYAMDKFNASEKRKEEIENEEKEKPE